MISPRVDSGFRRGWMKRPAFPLVRGGIGPCALVTDPVIGECLAEEMALVGCASVGYAPLDGYPMRRKEAERPLKEGGCAFFSSGRISVQANPEASAMATCSALPFQTLTTSATVALTMPVYGDALQLFGIDSKQFDDLPDKTKDFMSGLRHGELDTLDG